MLNMLIGYSKVFYKEDRGEILSHLIQTKDNNTVGKHYYRENHFEILGSNLLEKAKKTTETGVAFTAKCVSYAGGFVHKENIARKLAFAGGVIAVGATLPATPVAAVVAPIISVAAPVFAAANAAKTASFFAFNGTLICGLAGYMTRTIGRLCNEELMRVVESGTLDPNTIISVDENENVKINRYFGSLFA